MSSLKSDIRADGFKVDHVIQGEYRVSDDPKIVLTTILGSCVSMCLCDPVAKVGGMNHFLLPEGNGGPQMGFRYGLMAMELLINGLLKKGASKNRLEAKLFGGAILNSSLARIGDANSAFAREFLADEGIRCVSSSLGGTAARRIRYVPTTGSAQQMLLNDLEEEIPVAKPKTPSRDDSVTLF